MKRLILIMLIFIFSLSACAQTSTISTPAPDTTQQSPAADSQINEPTPIIEEEPEPEQELPYWADDLQNGDWYYIETIPSLNVEMLGSDFENITPSGRNIFNYTDDMTLVVISKDFETGEIIRDEEYEYYFGDYLQMAYIFFPNYEFDGEVYEIHFRYHIIEGFLFETAYLENKNGVAFLVSNCNVYSHDKDSTGFNLKESSETSDTTSKPSKTTKPAQNNKSNYTDIIADVVAVYIHEWGLQYDGTIIADIIGFKQVPRDTYIISTIDVYVRVEYPADNYYDSYIIRFEVTEEGDSFSCYQTVSYVGKFFLDGTAYER